MKRYIKPTLKKINLKFMKIAYLKLNNKDIEWLLTNQINENFLAADKIPLQ